RRGTNRSRVACEPDGLRLVGTEKAPPRIPPIKLGAIGTYTVGAHGLASGPIPHPSAGDFPFSVAFGKDGVLVVADDFEDVPGQGAASSYVASKNGGLRLVSGAVPNHQDGSCWVIIP